ncbi:MAG: hypothetical protein FJ125_11230 [Deltaproteobacteria bacterium]|nr:hypothetical protein [Deltaproteobacteria bacterium]
MSRRTLAGALLPCSTALLVLASQAFPWPGLAAPRFVRLSYTHPDTATSITVAWNTEQVRPSFVQLGPDASYGREVEGSSARWAKGGQLRNSRDSLLFSGARQDDLHPSGILALTPSCRRSNA